jgi:hypothetical protein
MLLLLRGLQYNKYMKRILPLLALTLFLAGCGGGGDSIAAVECQREFWDGEFGTCIPQGWGLVDSETARQRGVPADEARVIFQADEAVSGIFPTIVITQERLLQPVSSEDYSTNSVKIASTQQSYKLLDRQEFQIYDRNVTLHRFHAKPLAEHPLLLFQQWSTVEDDWGYTATAMMPVTVPKATETAVKLILESASFEEVVPSAE